MPCVTRIEPLQAWCRLHAAAAARRATAYVRQVKYVSGRQVRRR